MKKLSAVILVFCIFASFLAGCDILKPIEDISSPESTDPQPPAADVESILLSALEDSYPVLSQSGQYERLQKYLAEQFFSVPTAYAYVDFNGDGQKEMAVSTDSTEASSVVLYYGGEDVFFLLFTPQQMKQIKADGSFSGESGSKIIYSALEFPGGGYRIVNQAEGDYNEGTYSVGGAACDEKTFVDFEKEWAIKPNADWVKIDIQPVEKPAPETEPEPETTAVPEEDNSYLLNIPNENQKIYAGPGYHYDCVGDVGIAGIYTIVEEYLDSNQILWGKLKSGAGWVDLNDVRRSDKPITIDYADAELLKSGNFHNCDKSAGAHSTAVAFRAHETLRNIQIFYNTYDYDYNIESGYDIFYLKTLTPDKPIVAAISFTDTSVYFVSFEDTYGNFYLYEFYESGREYEIVMVER